MGTRWKIKEIINPSEKQIEDLVNTGWMIEKIAISSFEQDVPAWRAGPYPNSKEIATNKLYLFKRLDPV